MNVLPSSSNDYVRDYRLTNVKPFRHFSLTNHSGKFSYLANSRIGKLVVRVIFPFGNSFRMLCPFRLPSLFNFVCVIFSLGGKKKMRWANTHPTIAMVANIQILIKISKMNRPRSAMSVVFFSSMMSEFDSTISKFVFASRPQPAFTKMLLMLRDWTSLIRLFPKAFFEGLESLMVCAHNRYSDLIKRCWKIQEIYG